MKSLIQSLLSVFVYLFISMIIDHYLMAAGYHSRLFSIVTMFVVIHLFLFRRRDDE